MRQKIFVLVMMLMMCLSTVLIIPSDLEVEATGGGGEGEDNGIGLDLDFMWEVTEALAKVVHEYPPGMLRKGREFGTWGDNDTAEYLNYTMSEILNLENVTKLPIGPIADSNLSNRYYSSKIDINDLQLHIDHEDYTSDTGGWPSDVPKNETFAYPSCYPKNRGGSVTHNYSFEDEDDIRIRPTHDKWPMEGLITNDYLNVSSERASGMYDLVIGNATYISSGDPVPEQQDDMVFLIDEDEGCDDKLNNITNASAVILINDGSKGYKSENATKCSFSVTRINSTDSNLPAILEKIGNESVFVHNTLDNETLTFIYNLCFSIDWPDYNFVCTGMRNHSRWTTKTLFLRILNKLPCSPFKDYQCKGVILYDKYDDTHSMNAHNAPLYNGGWIRLYTNKLEAFLGLYGLPVFEVNQSVGLWLENHSDDPNNTITGYVDQVYQKEIHEPLDQPDQWTAGVTAHNVIGNRTIDKSPGDAIILISNRYDGWWSEAAFDSGGGAGIVMGIAKYFNDNNITPKYNLTFLMTTGEEYLFRGAQHFSDSHPNVNYTYWIGFDQLACDYDEPLQLTTKNEETRKIVAAIADETDYPERTNYNITNHSTTEFTGAEEDVWKERDLEKKTYWKFGEFTRLGIGCPFPCDTICFEKDPECNYTGRHRAGLDFTKGDTLEGLDRNDLNVTFEIAWNITKYFCVNPDCWFENVTRTPFDSDNDNLNDSINATFTIKTIIPHDLVMVNATLRNISTGDVVDNKKINYTVTPDGIQKTIILTVPENEGAGFYNCNLTLYNSTARINEILHLNKSNAIISFDTPCYLHPDGSDETTPYILDATVSAELVGVGHASNSITATVTSDVSEISQSQVYVYYPDTTLIGYSMDDIENSTYEYLFDNSWQNGLHYYCIWAEDDNGNTSASSWYTFDVSAQTDMSVCTVKDAYGENEIVNLTDPPGPPSQSIGYELLDDDKVLHIWNNYDSYYFDTDSGIQLTNHYDEYWSHNVLMLGYYDNDEWNLIYRTDELSGFNKDIDSDDETYVNATLWKDLNYEGYDFRLAIRYHLGVDDNELTIIPYIKNIDDEDIPYTLGFAWEINDIQVDMTPENDYIEIDGTWYYLNGTIDETYTNLDQSCYYIREDKSENTYESLYLRWDDSLNYKVLVESRDGQYNAPVTLGIKIGTLDIGQEKYTEMFWHDASEVVYYFDDYDDRGEVWTNNPEYMVDGNIGNYASTTVDGDVEFCDNNSCSGVDLGVISKVELRVFGYYSGDQRDIILRPVFNRTEDGNDHGTKTTSSPGWSEWVDITDDLPGSTQWEWSDVETLGCDVTEYKEFGAQFTLYCSKVEVCVTYNQLPVISDPYPTDGSTGVPLTPSLNITVSDLQGDLMNITWLRNSSGSPSSSDWQVFGTNNSVGNGTYHQVFANATENGQWWYWKVNVSDGTSYTESDVFSFYTGYQSKIENNGSTDIKGYLLMQVQYYNETLDEWVVANDTVNETSWRRINSSECLALDTIFNENVNTSDLLASHGNGTYRVYACFRDPDGDVLVCDDESLMEATYEFTITY